VPSFTKPHETFKDRYPLGKVRGRQGQEVREDTAPLDVDTLGEPSEVIVLRDVSIDAPKRQLDSEDGRRVKEHLSVNRILGSITREKDAPDQEAVDERLEGLRPRPEEEAASDPVVLSQDEFDALFRKIHDGFTGEQLGKYVAPRQSMRGLGKNEAKTLKGKKFREFMYEASKKSVWMPGVSPIERRLPRGPWAHAVTKKESPKAKLADRILRMIWGIEVIEEIEQTGELEAQFERWRLDLLIIKGTSTSSPSADSY